MEGILSDFVTEAGEMLESVDNGLIELETDPGNTELLNRIFRGFHTIKGGAGFLQVDVLVDLCHKTENLFDELRSGRLAVNQAMMDVILRATSRIREYLQLMEGGAKPTESDPEVLNALSDILSGKNIVKEEAPVRQDAAPPHEAQSQGEVDLDDKLSQYYDALMNDVLAKGKVASSPHELVPIQAPAADIKLPSAPQPRQEPAKHSQSSNVDKGIRVDTERLDAVLDLSGEIGLVRNRIASLFQKMEDGDHEALVTLGEAIEQMDVLVTDLQTAATKTRMQPVGKLFQKYPRVVRDLARQLNKDIELVIDGESTEIDKSMIEDLSDPLIHLIRNAVDHGIDMPQDRIAAGKPAKGTIRIAAEQAGDNIVITISDDGKGMSAAAIKKKCIEKGLITESDASALDEKQSINLIFLPGFSTKEQITDVSGRGVGMDVVKTNITKLSGKIEVTSSPGRGSVFRIQLPLTLAIIPVLMTRCGGHSFAIPLSIVREITQIKSDDISTVSGRKTMMIRQEIMPVFGILELLQGIHGDSSHGVVVSIGDTNFMLGIDECIGHMNVVVKPIDSAGGPGVSGATITGDGDVVVVLDVEALLKDYI